MLHLDKVFQKRRKNYDRTVILRKILNRTVTLSGELEILQYKLINLTQHVVGAVS